VQTFIGTMLATLFSLAATGAAERHEMQRVYIATAGADGIYGAELDGQTGTLTAPAQLALLSRAQWLTLHPRLPVLYSVGTTAAGRSANSHLHSLRIDKATGGLQTLNEVDAGGLDATHLDIDALSMTLFTANHDSGGIAALPIKADGTLGEVAAVAVESGSGPVPGRQARAISHCVLVDPSHRFVLVADLGADNIFVYRFNAATRQLSAAGSAPLPAGSGPRHMAWNPNGKFLYVLTELDSTLHVLGWDTKQGQLRHIQSLGTYPADYNGPDKISGAEIVASRDGKFVYISLRADQNSIVSYAIDQSNGTLKENQRIAAGGKLPRGFGIDLTGRWMLVANDGSNAINVFRIDQQSGRLTPTGQSISVPRATSVVFYPLR
jgi:6-phosphogluconolactonase